MIVIRLWVAVLAVQTQHVVLFACDRLVATEAVRFWARRTREAMTLPGLNAETSLYKTDVHYRSNRTAVQRAEAVPQLFDPPGTVCGPCTRFGWQFCVNCFIEPLHCFHWTQPCYPIFR